ncbi:MAG: Serine threonine- kinase haspin [Trebouxia sp. A1-2]|nr:MAG: Serine threonine- kinase haspin [Trebouxia sp. A1-2]
MYELALQALERQQNVHEVLESSNEDHPKARIEQEVVSRQAEVRPATKVLKENVPPAKEHLHKQKKNVVQYSRRPIPTAKQKEQAMQTQHLLEMKEYFAEVDDFQLAEETPVKAKPNSRSRTPVAASPEASEPQARPARDAASAEQRTAEWVTALSPVLEHDERQSPGAALQTHAAEASPAEPGGKQSLVPSLMSRLSSRFSIGNRLARLSTNWGVPDALQRLGLVDVANLPSMEELLGQFASLAHIKKIGEGTFGEAFKADQRLSNTLETCRSCCAVVVGINVMTTAGSPCLPLQLVFKIVPLEGDLLVNGETQKRSEEILAEVAIALTLSRLREPTSGPEQSQSDNITEGFVQTHGLGICRGRYAKSLIKEWHRWHDLHESENDAVDGFPGDQLYVVFVFADGGADLERFELRSFEEAQSILLQTALSLAIAEEACEFEHRDLHWGNLLVHRDSNKTISCRLRGHVIEASTSGVTVTLIDFTLSRLTALTGDVAFCDLAADPELFTGPKGDVQADTYRRMKKATKNRWQGHCPATNCLWMHYLADVVLNLKQFPMTAKQKKGLRDFRLGTA